MPRARATVAAVVEAANDILRAEGAGGLTTNRIAKQAGVNIASLYHYFPHKEALAFHIVKMDREAQLARLKPLLTAPGPDPARNLREFTREVLRIEADDAPLRRALRGLAIELCHRPELQALNSETDRLMRAFLKGAVAAHSAQDPDFVVNFIALMVTGFAERTADQGTSGAELTRQADLLTDTLIARFGISAARGAGGAPGELHEGEDAESPAGQTH